MDYRQKFVDLLKSLKANPTIEVTEDYIGPAIPEDDFSFNLILEHYKIELPEKIISFYHSMSSCKIEWQCDLSKTAEIKKMQPDDTIITGRIQILSIEKMLEFDKKLEAALWQDNLNDEEKKDLQNFRYMDFNDDYIRVGFIRRSNQIDINDIFFITQNSDGFTKSGLTFDGYIEKMLMYKGYQGWQYNYFFSGSENNKRMMYYLGQIFSA